jgi:hypothetical protein
MTRYLPWNEDDLIRGLREVMAWSKHRRLPATYSCNAHDVWPSITSGWSSPAERWCRTGESTFLDAVVQAARDSRPDGGRFEIQADGAYWVFTGRRFIEWQYVHPVLLM